jgi:DNA-binding transcriptional LysR family regulator
MHLLYPRDRRPTPKLTSFVDFMLARFGVRPAVQPIAQPAA